MAGASLTQQWQAVKEAPVLYLGVLIALALIIWAVIHYLHGARVERLKQDVESEKRDNERLRARIADLETRGSGSPAPSPLQIELEVWCKRWLDDAYKQVVAIQRVVEETNPWSDEKLLRSALAEVAKIERFVPSSKVANANTIELAQEFFLDALDEYDSVAQDVHDTVGYSLKPFDLDALNGYKAWRRNDVLLLQELRSLLATGKFPIASARLPDKWGEAERNEGWPKI